MRPALEVADIFRRHGDAFRAAQGARLRHYGFLANCCRGQRLALCRQLLRMSPNEPGCYLRKDYRQRYEELTGRSLTQCPVCQQGEMLVIEVLPDTRLRRHKPPAPRPQFANCPFMDTS